MNIAGAANTQAAYIHQKRWLRSASFSVIPAAAVPGAARAGARAQQQRRADADDEHAGGDRLQRMAPAERGDRRGGEHRHGERADADAGAGDAGRERAPANEPRRHAGARRRVDQADADAEARAPGDVDRRHRLREAARQQARGDEHHSGRAHQARPEAIGQHPGAGAEKEVDQSREAEDERDVGALGVELGAERAEERGERIGDAEDDRDADERRRDDHPGTRVFQGLRRSPPLPLGGGRIRRPPERPRAELGSRHELGAGQLLLGFAPATARTSCRGRARSRARATGALPRRRRSGSPGPRRDGCSSGRPSSRCRART